jgi:hypothetical protein
MPLLDVHFLNLGLRRMSTLVGCKRTKPFRMRPLKF